MGKFKSKYCIEPNRWKFWDYSSTANYFITICISERKCILGDVINKKMVLSDYGNIVKNEIEKIPEYHKRIILDEWVIMPNHIHLLITLGNYNFDNGVSIIGDNNHDGNTNGIGYVDSNDTYNCDGNGNDNDPDNGNDNVKKIHEFSLPSPSPSPPSPSQPPPSSQLISKPSIDEIKQYRKQRRKMIIPKLTGKFQMQTSKQINILRNTPGIKNWLSNYHDHVIRNNQSYKRIKEYIINNPKNWDNDKFQGKK